MSDHEPVIPMPGQPALNIDEKSGTISPVYEAMDSTDLKTEFDRINAELQSHVPALANAKATLDIAIPYLANMQSLLSQRGHARKQVLKQAGVPGWTPFIEGYSAKLGYTVRQMSNLIREHRNQAQAAQKAKCPAINCKSLLVSLLGLLEHHGDKLPQAVNSATRDIQSVLEGHLTMSCWLEKAKALDDLVQNNSLERYPQNEPEPARTEDDTQWDMGAAVGSAAAQVQPAVRQMQVA
jgi:hypothetical protein